MRLDACTEHGTFTKAALTRITLGHPVRICVSRVLGRTTARFSLQTSGPGDRLSITGCCPHSLGKRLYIRFVADRVNADL